MRSLIFSFLIFYTVNCYSAELELPGWERKVVTDIPEQKYISYSREYRFENQVFKTFISQVRNDAVWHWSQTIGIMDEESKFKKIAWNIVLDDGPMVQRWYSGSMPKGISYITIGEGEKDGYKSAKFGEQFLQIPYWPTDSRTEPESILFIANPQGIYLPRFVNDATEKIKF